MPFDTAVLQPPTPGDLTVLQVRGDAMAPEFQPGDHALVDRSATAPSPPGTFVLWDGCDHVLKRVEMIHGGRAPRVRLSSANPAYPAYECPLSDVRISGRVVGKWQWV